MIRAFLFSILCFLFCSSSLSAHPFLWKASGEHDFYLFGTIHLPDPRVTELPTEVNQALDEATAFYAELDLSESNRMKIAEFVRLTDGQDLAELLPESTRTKANKVLQDINPQLSVQTFSNLKVWVLAVTLLLIEQQQKYPTQQPLDFALYMQALADGKITGGLETNNDQLSIFNNLTLREQTKLLDDTIEFMEEASAENTSVAENSLNAYLQGDLEGLFTYLVSYMKDEPFYEKLLEQLIDDRNHRMTKEILNLVNENPDEIYFFAVGAGHFWGETGINKLLSEAGYSIENVAAEGQP